VHHAPFGNGSRILVATVLLLILLLVLAAHGNL
jgi:hypothetical protein